MKILKKKNIQLINSENCLIAALVIRNAYPCIFLYLCLSSCDTHLLVVLEINEILSSTSKFEYAETLQVKNVFHLWKKMWATPRTVQ